jgi:hypothetical protein
MTVRWRKKEGKKERDLALGSNMSLLVYENIKQALFFSLHLAWSAGDQAEVDCCLCLLYQRSRKGGANIRLLEVMEKLNHENMWKNPCWDTGTYGKMVRDIGLWSQEVSSTMQEDV